MLNNAVAADSQMKININKINGFYQFDKKSKTLYMSQLFLLKSSLAGTEEYEIFERIMKENGSINATLLRSGEID